VHCSSGIDDQSGRWRGRKDTRQESSSVTTGNCFGRRRRTTQALVRRCVQWKSLPLTLTPPLLLLLLLLQAVHIVKIATTATKSSPAAALSSSSR
jgi:hypothetical protein